MAIVESGWIADVAAPISTCTIVEREDGASDMPKYRVEWGLGDRNARLGALVFSDDDAAVVAIAELCVQEGVGAVVKRPDRKLTIADITPPSVN